MDIELAVGDKRSLGRWGVQLVGTIEREEE